MKLEIFEMDLPLPQDLVPLTQTLITPVIATVFGIEPEPQTTIIDPNTATHARRDHIGLYDPFPVRLFPGPAKLQRVEPNADDPDGSGRPAKRSRLFWTPELHKRFMDVIALLGVDKCVPKTIMEMMNVEGLSRENVASHLQKYRLYLKRIGADSQSYSRRVPGLFDYDGFGFGPRVVPRFPGGSYGYGHSGFADGNGSSSSSD